MSLWATDQMRLRPSSGGFLATHMRCAQFGLYHGRMVALEDVRVFISQTDHVRHEILIPEGYSFDGASIPRVLWPLLGHPFSDELVLPCCVHDWYCEHSWNYHDRLIGDAVLLSLLARQGVSRWRRIMMYFGVRLFSIFRWSRHT